MIAVRAARLYLDGTPKAGRQLFLASGPKRKARCRLFDDTARRHDHGLSERILRPSTAAGLLRGAAQPNGAGHNDADDPAGADLGATRHLHSGFMPERRRPSQSPNERGGGLLYISC